MCQLCDAGQPQDHTTATQESRRDFLKVSAATIVNQMILEQGTS
jgi:hypothetical protein